MLITFITNIFSPGQMTSVCIVVWSDGHQGQSKTDFMWVVELFSSLDICLCIPSSFVLLSATTWCTSWWPTASRWLSWQSATSRYLQHNNTNIYTLHILTHIIFSDGPEALGPEAHWRGHAQPRQVQENQAEGGSVDSSLYECGQSS